MADPVGVTFREKMAGGFLLGETDPQSGADRGHAEGDALAMHAVISIDDLDRFIKVPEHPGGLAGTLDYPPLGAAGMASTSGVFNLFSPSGDPTMTYMVYEMGFRLDAKDYYLAGKKEVRQAAITDMWKATTTLYTQLHLGADSSGPVIGAGILTLTARSDQDGLDHARHECAIAGTGSGGRGALWTLLPGRTLGHVRETHQGPRAERRLTAHVTGTSRLANRGDQKDAGPNSKSPALRFMPFPPPGNSNSFWLAG